jgi:hypothetical protein
VLSDRDQKNVEKAIAAAKPGDKVDVEALKKKIPVAPLPVGGATSITTFKDNKLYFDNKLRTYVFYEPKGGFTDFKVVSIYAATGETVWNTLGEKLNSYKKDTGKHLSYVANKTDLLSISEYDEKAVYRAVQGKSTKTNKNRLSQKPAQ